MKRLYTAVLTVEVPLNEEQTEEVRQDLLEDGALWETFLGNLPTYVTDAKIKGSFAW